jgi:glutamate synthase (NADPH/NADH) large chain
VSAELPQTYIGTATSTIGGIRLEEVARDAIRRHDEGFGPLVVPELLPHIGQFSFRKDGEKHAWNPETIATLQLATKLGSYKKFKEFTQMVDAKVRPDFPARLLPLEASSDPGRRSGAGGEHRAPFCDGSHVFEPTARRPTMRWRWP